MKELSHLRGAVRSTSAQKDLTGPATVPGGVKGEMIDPADPDGPALPRNGGAAAPDSPPFGKFVGGDSFEQFP